MDAKGKPNGTYVEELQTRKLILESVITHFSMTSKSKVQCQNTVHFEMKKLSTKSSWEFECVLHVSDKYR